MKTRNIRLGILTVVLLAAFGISVVVQGKPFVSSRLGRDSTVVPQDRSTEQFKKETPKPPAQPATGPGGADYSHSGVRESVYGEGDDQYWIFEPISPTLKSAPLIVFNHGWAAMSPKIYGAWIEHLVRKGNIVIFPRYQGGLLTLPERFTPNAIKAIKDALKRLQGQEYTQPQLDKFAMVGHSMGGILTANIAALAKSEGLPEPKAIMVVQPGVTTLIELADLSKIPAGTLMLSVVGDKDFMVGEGDAKKIFEGCTAIPAENKDFIRVVSDYYGKPALVADHLSPVGSGGQSLPDGRQASRANVNALDYYAYWRLFDALTNCAFYGKDRESALGNTPQQRYMGKWSDGTPVKELVVTDKP